MPLPLQDLLDDAGLNRQHVFALADLPPELLAPMAPAAHERQLLLFGHAGRRLWERVQAEGGSEEHPIDAYSVRTVQRWLAQALPGARARFVYPEGLRPGQHVGLQRLGQLAGWHHPSPFMVGVDSHWGSWFAYRAAILTDTALPPSPREDLGHPCPTCTTRACVSACRGKALSEGPMDFQACQSQRLQDGSPCALGCPARQACPVGAAHRYESSQIAHASRYSLQAIRRYASRPRG
ncbi:hypothetical protein RQP54_18970 [Curvibacter sp. APW13]|uniref:hypothetical protein n=1 Tax=Curvibacter sp. APW13 TaxID=3077236 RepID=UPI0028DD54C2|nr:hypothetical protein [Curvibacter sp. APW13]MDT8992963.1 hypothetical protein [Curvibacter sp. APW13]